MTLFDSLYRMVAYEGILSRDFIVLIENDPRVVSYQEEPEPFPWFDGLKWHSYTPDFSVLLDDGRRICVEIKPYRRLRKLPAGFRDGSPPPWGPKAAWPSSPS